jgi:hypothetical protein
MRKNILYQMAPEFVLSVIFFSACSQGKILHVSHTGLPGISPVGQMRSVQEAVSNLSAGDTVIIHEGVYREQVTIEPSGTEEKTNYNTSGNRRVRGCDRCRPA